MTMDILGGMSKKTDTRGGQFKETKKANYSEYFKTRKTENFDHAKITNTSMNIWSKIVLVSPVS